MHKSGNDRGVGQKWQRSAAWGGSTGLSSTAVSGLFCLPVRCAGSLRAVEPRSIASPVNQLSLKQFLTCVSSSNPLFRSGTVTLSHLERAGVGGFGEAAILHPNPLPAGEGGETPTLVSIGRGWGGGKREWIRAWQGTPESR
jgi:hypothetical protein